MKLEQQVTSLEISKRLKELGVLQESYFMWEGMMADVDKIRFSLKKSRQNGNPMIYSAFTVSELGGLLPNMANTWRLDGQWKCYFYTKLEEPPRIVIDGDTEADARGKMLIHLLENKLYEIRNQ